MSRLFPPELPLGGGCPCEAVRFSITAIPLLVYACHCTRCQRRSGSAFGLSMLVKTESFAVTRGTPKFWRQIGAGGINDTCWFCGDCGGGIACEKSSHPDTTVVHAGTLDDAADRACSSSSCAGLAADPKQHLMLRDHAERFGDTEQQMAGPLAKREVDHGLRIDAPVVTRLSRSICAFTASF